MAQITKLSKRLNGETKSLYVSLPINKVSVLEKRLRKIFDMELAETNSILINYKPDVITKLAKFISGKTSRAASIGIAGETASGKSTITLDIIETINSFATEFEIENVVTRVNTDDYYYDRSDMVKKAGSFSEFAKNYDLDIPQALELELMCSHIKSLLAGNSVMLPKYDMSGTAIRIDNHTLAKPSKIIISEGLFTLTDKIKSAFDFKIYVDIDSEIQKSRFFERATERGLGDSAEGIYQNANTKADIYIRPCKFEADIILSGEANRARYKEFLNKIISIVHDEYFENITIK